jgi:hypothetical protein
MLTNQGTTQVYSPFGTYVVEQHGPACEDTKRGERDTEANEWHEHHAFERELPKAA